MYGSTAQVGFRRGEAGYVGRAVWALGLDDDEEEGRRMDYSAILPAMHTLSASYGLHGTASYKRSDKPRRLTVSLSRPHAQVCSYLVLHMGEDRLEQRPLRPPSRASTGRTENPHFPPLPASRIREGRVTRGEREREGEIWCV
jgi:hypothetical protein